MELIFIRPPRSSLRSRGAFFYVMKGDRERFGYFSYFHRQDDVIILLHLAFRGRAKRPGRGIAFAAKLTARSVENNANESLSGADE